MQTATRPIKPARRRATQQPSSDLALPWADPAHVVLAPVPPFMADFLHHMQAELIKAADNAPPPGSIVLQPQGALKWEHSTTRSIAYDKQTYQRTVWYQRQHQCRAWPAWQVEEDRTDTDGECWSRERYCTVDDFGTLVPVRRGFDEDALWGEYA